MFHEFRVSLYFVAFALCMLMCDAVIAGEQAATDPNWFALEPVKDSFGPTVLDCSRWVEAPTGKHGFVTVKGDRFVFEDGTPTRFWGAQMGGFSKEQIDYAGPGGNQSLLLRGTRLPPGVELLKLI